MKNLQEKISEKLDYEKKENFLIKKLQNYTKNEVLSIFKKFSKQINYIYWSQKNFFLKLLNFDDRNSYILELNWKKIWVLVYKNSLQNEEKNLKLKNWYIELKSFFLFDEFWEWNIWYLWDLFLKEIEKNFGEKSDWIYVTVSKTKANSSYEMFKKIWFEELYSVKNEYFEWNEESHLFYEFKK